MTRRKRIALIGLGMAVTPHAKSLMDLADRVEVVHAISPSRRRRQAFAERFAFALGDSLAQGSDRFGKIGEVFGVPAPPGVELTASVELLPRVLPKRLEHQVPRVPARGVLGRARFSGHRKLQARGHATSDSPAHAWRSQQARRTG
jgi:hypothetical protein